MDTNARGHKLLDAQPATSTPTITSGLEYDDSPSSSSFTSASSASSASLRSRLHDLILNPNYNFVSVTHDASGGRERLSVYKTASLLGSYAERPAATDAQLKTLEDTVSAAHRRLTHTGDELHHVQQRLTLICADGNALSERVATAATDIRHVQLQLVQMEKELERVKDGFRAEMRFVYDKIEKKDKAHNARLRQIEALVGLFDATL